MHYLKHTLLDIKSSFDADKYFGTGSKNSFSEAMLDLLESQGFSDLPSLILKSRILREYSTDKLVHILAERCSEWVSATQLFQFVKLNTFLVPQICLKRTWLLWCYTRKNVTVLKLKSTCAILPKRLWWNCWRKIGIYFSRLRSFHKMWIPKDRQGGRWVFLILVSYLYLFVLMFYLKFWWHLWWIRKWLVWIKWLR